MHRAGAGASTADARVGAGVGAGVATAHAGVRSGSISDALWASLKGTGALSGTTKGTTLLLVLFHRDGGQGRGAVDASFVVVNLVDWHSGVDNLGLNGLLVQDGLDGLVDVMVNMLALDNGRMGLGTASLINDTLVAHLTLLSLQSSLDASMITVIKLPVDRLAEVGRVLLGKHLPVMDGLLDAVIVILVNLLVDSSANLLMLSRLDDLLLNGRGDGLVGSGVVVTRLGDEVFDGSLCPVHDCGVEFKADEKVSRKF